MIRSYGFLGGRGLRRAMVSGAALGVGALVLGNIWSGLGQRSSINTHDLVVQALIGGVAGAVIAFVLYFTKAFRGRSLLHHYASWVVACVVAAVVLVLPTSLADIWNGLGFALWLGVGAGLGLGLTERQLTAADNVQPRER
jgi:hypothetical protein